MLELLEQQRAAFFSDLPVSTAIREDRLRRAVTMLEENSGALCAALCRDGAQPDQESAMRVEVSPALMALRDALRGAAAWTRPLPGQGLWRRLARRGGTEYRPVGVVGVAAPAVEPLRRTMTMLADALAAGNRIMVRFDTATPHLGRLAAQLAPRYFSPLELHIVDGQVEGAEAFETLPFDLFVPGEPFEGAVDAGRPVPYSGRSPAVIGRSADLAKAAEAVIAHRLSTSAPYPVPDYLLVPAEEIDTLAPWLWRAALRLRPAHIRTSLPLSGGALARFNHLIQDARARGAEILIAEPDARPSETAARPLPLHIVRHATDDMLLMQEGIEGPILPLLGYGDIDQAIDTIHRHGVPAAIYHFGLDNAERGRLLARTVSSVIALDGRPPEAAPGTDPPPKPDRARGRTGFRTFSRARRVFR